MRPRLISRITISAAVLVGLIGSFGVVYAVIPPVQQVFITVEEGYDPACVGSYNSARSTCQGKAFACYDVCEQDLTAGRYPCKDACMKRDRDCIAAANEQYKACVSSGGALPTTTPPTASAPPEQPVQALVENQPTVADFADHEAEDKKAGLREGSDEQRYFGTPYGPYISNAQSNYTFSYRITFTRKDGDPSVLLPDGSKLDYRYQSFANDRSVPAGTKIITPPGVKVRLQFILDETRKTTAFGYDPYADDNVFTRTMSVDIEENTELTVEEVYGGFVKIVVNKGFARFHKRKPVPLMPASPAGVMLGTKGTDFGMAYDPETKQTTAEIYDGTIEIIDLENKRVLRTLTTTYGESIFSAQIASDKTIIEKTAIPRSEWDAFIAGSSVEPSSSAEKGAKGGSGWLFVILILLLGGLGFWLYEKKYKQKA